MSGLRVRLGVFGEIWRCDISVNEQGGDGAVIERWQEVLLLLALLAVACFLFSLVWLHGPDAQMTTMPGM